MRCAIVKLSIAIFAYKKPLRGRCDHDDVSNHQGCSRGDGCMAWGGLPIGEAQAVIPDNGVYTGCYQKSGGTLRVIDASQQCKSSEIRITWNEVGPRGDQGPAGPQGPQGEQGPAGVAVQADPPCFDNLNRYVDCGNGTVTDTVTGLIWLKEAGCLGPSAYAAANDAAAALQHGDCNLTDNSARFAMSNVQK